MGYLQEASENRVKKMIEEALLSKMKTKALRGCDQYMAQYAECAVGRTISVEWKCRQQCKAMHTCLQATQHMLLLIEEQEIGVHSTEEGEVARGVKYDQEASCTV